MDKSLISVVVVTMNRIDKVSRCIDSILKSTHLNFEIVVVDNNSTDSTYEILQSKYGLKANFSIFRSAYNLGAAGGRNQGAAMSRGDYFLFVDDDNCVAENMLENLYAAIRTDHSIGLIGPVALFLERPERVWLYSADISLWSGRATYKGNKELFTRSEPVSFESGHIPNCFMVARADFLNVKGFDEYYIIMFEESDFAEKIKKQTRKKVVVTKNALTYHDVPYESAESFGNSLGIRSPTRAYLLSRNRMHFVNNNANLWQRIIFHLFYNIALTLAYTFLLSIHLRWDLASAYLCGCFDGAKDGIKAAVKFGAR